LFTASAAATNLFQVISAFIENLGDIESTLGVIDISLQIIYFNMILFERDSVTIFASLKWTLVF
jgi:hypothetical protein